MEIPSGKGVTKSKVFKEKNWNFWRGRGANQGTPWYGYFLEPHIPPGLSLIFFFKWEVYDKDSF